uniref:WGS project CAEQ00000000 data, annotated contig 1978 n=1 Tax=Trypanosoma congolense (strain IL3000) TaxID=1068625 RepID=F9WAI8_TRYCI|nr:unnamed protein product [Trypanosoma congolense IL3000]
MITYRGVDALFVLLLTFQWAHVSQAETVKVTASPIGNKPVNLWSVTDVEYWMNNTVGYPEYSGYVRKHLVDGPTLMEMTPADFEEHFPIENSIHVIKITAHMKLAKGLCSCGEDSAQGDFWSYFKREQFRVFVVGATSLFFPRVSMIYTFLSDKQLYGMLLGGGSRLDEVAMAAGAGSADSKDTHNVPLLYTLLFLIFLIAAPDIFMALQACRMITTNYFIMPLVVVHFLFQAYGEYILLVLIYSGNAFPPGTSLARKLSLMYSYTLAIPPIVFVLYFFIPYFLQVIVVCFLLLNVLIMCIGVITVHLGGARSAEGPRDKTD